MSVVIVRDRESAGGGIHNYYRAIGGYLTVAHEFVDVGRSHVFYDSAGSKRTRSLPTPLRLGWDWACLLWKLCHFPDLVHLNPGLDIKTRKSLRRDAVNLLLAKFFRRKVLVFWRGWQNEACGTPEFPGGNDGWLSLVYRRADAHIVLAGDFHDDLRRWGFTTPIYLETTVVADTVLEHLSAAGRQNNDGLFRILFLSRVEVAKGVFEMLDAFALLESRIPGRFHLTIAGDGPALDDLKQRSSKLGLKDIEFMGYVDGTLKSECYGNADVFCFLSYTEGMPNAVLEAMAMGLPLVSSVAGGLKDILQDGLSGYVVPYDPEAELERRFSTEEVASRIERLAAEPEIRQRMADRNRLTARECFSAERVAARLEAIYRKVLGGEVDRPAGATTPESSEKSVRLAGQIHPTLVAVSSDEDCPSSCEAHLKTNRS
jgi:glycosyltransferase involved in cell wall biosynthesis